jgi:hypothetical protein
MKKIAFLAVMVLILCACASKPETIPSMQAPFPPTVGGQLLPPPPTPTPIMPPELQGDVEVQQLLLTSHNRWKTLVANYSVTTYPTPGQTADADLKTNQIWISQPAMFKVMIGSPQGNDIVVTTSDGVTIADSQGNLSPVPAYFFEPFNPPNYPSDTVYLHPVAGYLGTPVSDLIFPAGLAQRGGEYRITGNEIVAGREARVVEWGREPGTLIDRFWIDNLTGIILRQQNYGKQSSGSPFMDIQATSILIDGDISAETFDLAQMPTPVPTPELPEPGTASIKVLDLKGILNVRSGPNTSYKIVTTLEPGTSLPVIGKNEAGDWWKVDLGNEQVGWVFGSFVEFSGDADSVPVTQY